MRFDLLIRGGVCVLPWGEEQTDVGVLDGRVAALGDLRTDTAADVFDAKGLHVLPGLIDSHVHLRDPGDARVETLSTGTRGAVLGGIATVFDMPNTQPPIVDHDSLASKRAHAEQVAWCDVGIYVAGSKTNIDSLAALESEPGVCAI
jgi:dihydroorotase